MQDKTPEKESPEEQVTQPTRVPINDLFALLGQKELELTLLRQEVAKLQTLVQTLQQALAKSNDKRDVEEDGK